MLKYIMKRLALSVLILFCVSLIIFTLIQLMPMDYVTQQIAAIGRVQHDNLAEVGERIARAEAALDALLQKMQLSGEEAADYVKYYFLLVPNIFVLEDARQAYDALQAEVQHGIAVSLTASCRQQIRPTRGMICVGTLPA